MQQQVRSCKGHMDKLNSNYERAQLLADSKERHKQAAANTRSGNSSKVRLHVFSMGLS